MHLNRNMTAMAAGTLAAFAQTAMALPPSTVPDITIKVAGSTIQDNNIVALLGQICKPGSLDNYKDSDASGKGTYYKAFFCTIDSSKVPGLTLKDPALLILKRNKSGVITGVYPLLEPTKPIPLMGINNTVTAGGASQPQCTASTTANSWTCRTDRAGDIFNATPDMAVADVDPQLMRGVNYASTIDGITFNQPTSALVAANLTVINAGAVMQNTPVTLDLRNALQLAQIEQGALPVDCHAGDETERCMPSLSRGLIASLFAGRIGHWSDIKVESTAGVTPLTHYNGGPAGDDLVRLCRRNRGASTQASFNAYFLNIPCSSSGVTPVEVSNPLAGPIVATPPQVTTTADCLADFNDG
ncbi:MAG: hypothetical protein PHE55_09330, partial [Methylococcaceae bacterium]|nr:hypothetical protein [Methylococcaceae bacterium]